MKLELNLTDKQKQKLCDFIRNYEFVYQGGKIVYMKKKPCIPFNIWDDYWDDGYVPQGKVQETYGYIEEYDTLTDEDKVPIVKFIYEYITKELDLTGVKVELAGTNINFTNLTHARREYMMERLKNCKLQYNGMPIKFYSES